MMLKISGERGHPCLVPDLSGKASGFSPLIMRLFLVRWGVFLVGIFYQVMMLPSISSLLRVFVMNGVGFCKMVFLHLLT